MGIRSDLFRSSKCLVSKKYKRRIMQCCYSTHEIPHVTNNAHTWIFPKIVIPQNGWFIIENPLKWMIWGYHHLRKHPHATGFPSFGLPVQERFDEHLVQTLEYRTPQLLAEELSQAPKISQCWKFSSLDHPPRSLQIPNIAGHIAVFTDITEILRSV